MFALIDDAWTQFWWFSAVMAGQAGRSFVGESGFCSVYEPPSQRASLNKRENRGRERGAHEL